MNQVVATREYQLKISENETTTVTMRIGLPFLTDDGYMWECPFWVDDLGEMRVHRFPGEDPMAALLFALKVAQGYTESLMSRYGERISFRGNSDLLPPYRIELRKDEENIAPRKLTDADNKS